MANLSNDSTDTDYPTDEFGHPDGRDYHYRIPLNDDTAVRLASWALHEMLGYSDRFVTEWDDFAGDELAYIGIQTHDSKGHLDGLAEYAYSPRWQDVSDRVTTDVDEYRQNPSGAGTLFRGTFQYDPTGDGVYRTLEYETSVAMPPTEFAEALEGRGESFDEVREAIRWGKRDAEESYRERRAEAQRACEHDRTLDIDDLHSHDPRAVAYCEDCEAEIDEDGEVVWG